MVLVGRDGSRFELTITGYQFPAIRDDGWDSNWLMVRIDVRAEQGAWSRADPSLMTTEVQALERWLGTVARRQTSEWDIGFIEPNLAFELREESEEYVTLRVFFELELRPPWAPSEVADEGDVWVDLAGTRRDLRQAALDLRAQLREFPPRVTPSGA